VWSKERYPFGSEQAWDSTGQEGVYLWAKFFNDSNTRLNALNSILGYQPTVPHWGYNGNARRYWDNIYGGKLMRFERQIHHYGSGLNALPLMAEFMTSPSDYYLLRTAFGGLSGPISNIDQQGFAAASFHSFPDTLAWDAYSGDYGPNFMGHSMGMSTVVVNHRDFGWQAFGGNVQTKSPKIQVNVVDSIRRRIYMANLGVLFSLDAGAFSSITWDPSAKTISLGLLAVPPGISTAASAPQGRLLMQQMATVAGVSSLKPSLTYAMDAGAFVIPFTSGDATVVFVVS